MRHLLTADFLAPYLARHDVFDSLLARSVYSSKYRRDGETWAQTVLRCVEGNVALDSAVTEDEARKLYHAFFTMQFLPPGRGLWTGGVPDMPVEGRYNCFYVTLRSIEDWCWGVDMLMCGGGVGFGLYDVNALPPVARGSDRLNIACVESHPNHDEVAPDLSGRNPGALFVEDSREGWVDALRQTFLAAWQGQEMAADLSRVRPRGAAIVRFGGIAPGPGPLAKLLRSVWRIVRGAAGRRLTSVECLDITNLIGVCIKSGNVRRSAQIALGSHHDQPFRDAKKDMDAVVSHRHSSNNSIVFRSHDEARSFDYHALARDLASNGEPGIVNLAQCHPLTRGVNPCFEATTLVHTRHGHFRISDLVGKTADVWDGERWRTVSTFDVTGKDQPMLRITMQDGSTMRVTPYHKMVLSGQREMVEAKDLKVGQRLEISTAPESHGEVSMPGAYLAGFLVGDGTTGDNHPVLWLYETKRMCADALVASACEVPLDNRKLRSDAITMPGFLQNDGRWTMQALGARSDSMRVWVREYKQGLPAEAFAWNARTKSEFLAGLFDADGTATDSANGFSYQLTSVSKQLLRDVQALLSTMGVRSRLAICKHAGKVDLNDGYGEYETRDCWRLSIGQAGSVDLARRCNFRRLTSFANRALKYNCKPRFNEVVAIEPDGVDDQVFCLVTEDPDRIALTNGLLVGRCGEVELQDREACCLSEVFPGRRDGHLTDAELFRLAARYTLRQRLTPMIDPEAEGARVRNMRIGVGLGGVCDFEWSETSLRAWYRLVREEANRYADALGVARPIAVTTVKPGGTVSLVASSSPGMHAPFADYYLRRTRIGKSEPMAAALMEAGVPHEEDMYDSTGQTLVFEFPVRSHYRGPTVQTESTRDQFERQAALQRSWSDNAVSATIGFDPGHVEPLAHLLAEYAPQLKSTSCLPRDGGVYQQAPYQVIDRAEYKRRHAAINHAHPLAVAVDDALVVDECAGGSCPTR